MPPMTGYVEERTGNVVNPTTGLPTTNVPTLGGAARDPITGLPVDPLATGAGLTAMTPFDELSGMAPPTGWAKDQGYTPIGMNEAYSSPWAILADVFKGINPSSPLYQSLRELGADPLALFNMMVGSTRSIDQGGSDFVNFLQRMYQEQGTRGGKEFNMQGLLGNIFGAGGGGDETGIGTTLSQILSAGGQGDQIRTLFNLLRDASNVGMNPMAARGYQAAVARTGDQYGNAMMKAESPESMNPAKWFSENAPSLTGRR